MRPGRVARATPAGPRAPTPHGCRRFGHARHAKRTGQPVALATASLLTTPGCRLVTVSSRRRRVRLHDAQIRDHLDRARRFDAQPGTSVAARRRVRATSRNRAFDHAALRVRHHDEDPLAARPPFRARRPHLAAAPSAIAYGPITVVLMLPKRSSCAAPRKPTVIRPLCSQ